MADPIAALRHSLAGYEKARLRVPPDLTEMRHLAAGVASDGWALLEALEEAGIELPVDHSDDEDTGCEGHESLAGHRMGETVYCDGTCRPRAK